MTRCISIHESAEIEINDAADFYDLESRGLGVTFLSDIENAISHLREFPEAAPILLGQVRRIPLFKFPFFLIYSLREDEIRILAIAHQKRRPFYWLNRR